MPDIVVTATGNVTGGVTALKSLDDWLKKCDADTQKFAATSQKAGAVLNTNLKTGANQATFAMTNLGRVFQDAPFGIIGVTNNINPLLESFQRLKAETGSTGGALKALAGSLMGAGGLGLAVSVISGLLTVFALNNRSAGAETKEHKEKIDETKKAADEYASAISRASSQVLSHQGKLVELNRVLRDTSNNFNTLSQSIINQALAEYLATQKEGLIKKILDAKVKEILAAQSAFSKVREFTSKDLFSKDPLKKQVAEAQADLVNLNNLVNSLGLDKLFEGIFKLDKAKKVKDIRTIEDVLKDLGKELTFLSSKEDILNVDETKGKLSALQSAFDELIKDFKLTGKSPIIIDIVGRINKIEFDQLSDEFMRQQREAMKNLPKRTVGIETPIIVKPKIQFIDPVIDKEFEAFATRINAALEGMLEDSLSGLGEAIGTALAGGSIDGLFDGIINSLGQQLKELGKFLIQTGVIMEVAKKALKALFSNPLAQVVVGIGLVALGALLQASVRKKAPGLATGVRDFQGGSVVNVGERGPERIFLPVHSRVQPNNEVMAYGGGNQVFIPAITLSGSDLVIAFNRASQQMGRNN